MTQRRGSLLLPPNWWEDWDDRTSSRADRQPAATVDTAPAARRGGCFGLFYIAGAQAVHDERRSSSTATYDNSCAATGEPDRATQPDWDGPLQRGRDEDVASVDPSNAAGLHQRELRAGLRVEASNRTTAAVANTRDDLLYRRHDDLRDGSKDTLNITPAVAVQPGQQRQQQDRHHERVRGAYHIGPDGDKIIYFGLEKNKDNGNNNVGFWFLQSNADCDAQRLGP